MNGENMWLTKEINNSFKQNIAQYLGELFTCSTGFGIIFVYIIL